MMIVSERNDVRGQVLKPLTPMSKNGDWKDSCICWESISGMEYLVDMSRPRWAGRPRELNPYASHLSSCRACLQTRRSRYTYK